jgi:hypothetical protein
MKDIYGKLCLWRDSFMMYRDRGISTTFDGFEVWTENTPLHKCILCDGFDEYCYGYAPLDAELRKMMRQRRRHETEAQLSLPLKGLERYKQR